MLKKIAAQILATVFVLTLVSPFNAGVFNDERKDDTKKSPPVQNCSRTTDDELTRNIMERLEAVPEIRRQMSHLNVSVKNRVVKLEGWLSNAGLVARARTIAKNTRCVRSVVSKLKTRGGGSCGPGQKPCGDICIDKGSECNIGND